ncbi:steroid dehydrogenase-like protein [Heterostelium album PN500]|uniref:Steroid dehydrogenase-like protein n=1 Tax=Heterostelium pallidum (strain ATCC 26659 / Pp 5 / PN500) TaxID=670386 RepID=D3BEA8_HETP5|nr:steroid dehydrogenase-like protein [Heterostelium album PN500]EFA80239.1 steroid dehydrogenase-like protein [Heterostelium album PN500]|eukprot:XP_020432359.1 steroid dehydrogenase-like protein [Heterostelium album PN500]
MLVITGATDGIGRAYTHELARRGMNVCLISRSEDKLKKETEDIQQKFKVQTKHIAFDFNTTKDDDYLNKLLPQLNQIEVGILVNNVGISYDHPMYLEELPNDRIDALINLNVRAATVLSKAILPSMLERKRGAIINLASISGMASIPFLSVYSGTKAFIERFSTSLNCEYANRGIFVQCIAPGIVVSNMSKIRKPSLFIPMPNVYARAAINCIGYEKSTAGYWAHRVQTFLITVIPTFISEKLMYDMHFGQRKRALAKKKTQ